MSYNIKCSREEAANITLEEYSKKYFKLSQINGSNTTERKDSYEVSNKKNDETDMIIDIEPKPFHIRKFNHKNYWRDRKRKYWQNNCNLNKFNQNNYSQNRKNNQVAVQYLRNNRKSRWSPAQPYQQLLNSYNTLTKHLPSLLHMKIDLPNKEPAYNVSNPYTSLVETTKPTSKASIDQMSTLADQLLKKFDTLYEIRQSIKVEQERKTKYNIPIQKEIASIQNKTLFVKCPNTEVVTSDGPGLEGVDMPVHSTNLSNNMRFA